MVCAFAFEMASWPASFESWCEARRSRITSPAIQMLKIGMVLYKESKYMFELVFR